MPNRDLRELSFTALPASVATTTNSVSNKNVDRRRDGIQSQKVTTNIMKRRYADALTFNLYGNLVFILYFIQHLTSKMGRPIYFTQKENSTSDISRARVYLL